MKMQVQKTILFGTTGYSVGGVNVLKADPQRSGFEGLWRKIKRIIVWTPIWAKGFTESIRQRDYISITEAVVKYL